MILATFMYTTNIKPTTTTLIYIRYFLFPKKPTSIMNNILLQYFRKMSLFHYWPSISICCVRPTYVVQQIVIKEFSLSNTAWRMAQRFPKWPHKSDGPFSCAAKRENHFSWICAHLLLLLQSICIVLPCMCESCQETAEKPDAILDIISWLQNLERVVTCKMATDADTISNFYLQKMKKVF